MEREFPKNVRQIGNVSDEPKIYMEDYVDTYLNQLKGKAVPDPVGVVLTGEILSMNGQDVVYIAGALQMQSIQVEGSEIIITDETWKQLEEEKKTFFSGQDIVGWCMIESSLPAGSINGAGKIHEKRFKKENTVFVRRDAVEPEEVIYANKFGELMQIGGYYIFYEKNPSMQSYMINTRKKIGVTPSEVVEDRAAKNFRSAIKEKREYKEQQQNSRFVYAMSVMLVIVVLVIGISTINNYGKMESVQNSLETLSQAVSRSPAQAEAVSERDESGIGELVQESTINNINSNESDVDVMEENETVSEAETEDDSVESISDIADGTAEEQNYYVVQSGDTLDGISIKMYGSRGYVDAICRMNGLSDGNLIIIGQKLLLP